MADPIRLFGLLELLQGRTLISGRELSDRLGVDPRTIRRTIARLQESGVPIEGQRGVGGGYRIKPGYRLPPLMLDNDEALAVSLGLLAARRLPLVDEQTAIDRALAKVHRVLPDQLRRRLEGLDESLGFTTPVGEGTPIGAERALVLTDAIRRRRRLRVHYVDHADRRSTRTLSPWRLVIHTGRWYLAAFDHDRGAQRIFRADRCSAPTLVDGAFEPAPEGFDAVAEVRQSFSQIPRRWRVDVVVALPIELAAARLPLSVATLTAVPGGTRVEAQVDSLDWFAVLLAGLDCELDVANPPELEDSLRAFAGRLAARTRPRAS